MEVRKQFTEEEIKILSPMEKIAVVAVKNREGSLHLSLLTSLIPATADSLTMGEFIQGRSKVYMEENPEIAFAFLSLQGFKGWRGRARWMSKRKEGPELEMYKQMPMHRYNAYFPVHTVHYLGLEELTGPEPFAIPRTAGATLAGMLAGASRKETAQVLKPYGEEICRAPVGLRYLAYTGGDGWPVIIPVHHCRAAGTSRLILTGGPNREELKKIPPGTEVAVLSAKLTLENVLVRGIFSGFKSHNGIRAAAVDINWVYNSMPPNTDQIYPTVPLEGVRAF